MPYFNEKVNLKQAITLKYTCIPTILQMLTYYNYTLYHLIILKTFKNKILVRNNITENEKH